MPKKNEFDVAPLYVTIGPQCVGKTSHLNRHLDEVADISIDDQKGVYHPVPIDVFINPDVETGNLCQELKLYNKTVKERLNCPTQVEMRLILKHFIDNDAEIPSKLSLLRNQFSNIAKKYASNNPSIPYSKLSYNDNVLDDLMCAIKSFHSAEGSSVQSNNPEIQFKGPNNSVDLFVQEAIFSPPASALDQAKKLLGLPPNKPYKSLQNRDYKKVAISWGNTNLRPTDYTCALEIAQKDERPVHFIVYQSFAYNPVDEKDERPFTFRQIPFELPYLSRVDLFRRNIIRLCATGRYINVKAIDFAIHQCRKMLWAAHNEIISSSNSIKPGKQDIKNKTYTKLDLDKALASLAGFEMGNDRKVIKKGPPKIIFQKPQSAHQRKRMRDTKLTRSIRENQSNRIPIISHRNNPQKRMKK